MLLLRIIIIVFSGYSAFGLLRYPEEEIVINSGDSTTLECFGTKPVFWINQTTYSTESKSYDGMYYTATLQINNAEFWDTGYYVCNRSDSHDPVYHSRMYLYVRDPDHLLVHEDFLMIYGEQHGTVVFPCRPTAPNIHVTLTKYEGEEEEVTPDKMKEHGVDMSYNPKVGYTLHNINFEDWGHYECKAKHNDMLNILVINLEVLAHTDSIPKPYMNISDETILEEGAYITILCRAEVQLGTMFEMKWFYPAKEQGHLNIGHIKEIDALGDSIVNVNNELVKEGRTTLIITNISKEDSGVYACKVEDHRKNVNSIEKVIYVHPATTSYLNVSILSIQDQVIDATGNVKFVVKIKAYPWPHVEWFGPNGVILNDTRHLVFTEASQTYLSITDIKIQDTGNYSVKVENNNGTVWKNYTLTVRGPPSVEIISNDLEEYYMKNTLYTVKCRVLGYPQPNVSWLYRGCDSCHDCDSLEYEELSKSNFSNIQEGKYVVSTASVTALKNGQLICSAKNSFSVSNKTVNFTISDVNNGAGFHMSGITTYSERETSSIYCVASVSKYSDSLKWKRENSYKKENSFDGIGNNQFS